MEGQHVLELMRAFFQDRMSPEQLAGFADIPARSVLTQSLDVVDFVVYLEDELKREIDLMQLESLFDLTFGGLAQEVSKLLVTA